MRLKLITAFFLIIFLGLVTRLFYWQVVKAKSLSKEARIQHEFQRQVFAPRGNILAKGGSWLVGRGEAYLVYAELPKIQNTSSEIANKLAPIFIEDAQKEDRKAILTEIDRLSSLLKKKDLVWVPLKAKVSSLVKANVESQKIKGIGFEKIEDRLYPEASTAAQLLGFVGKKEDGNDTGYFGLEGYYNLSLSGKPGFSKEERDASGKPILISDSKEAGAIEGINLLTHVDKSIQLMVERKLKEGIDKYGASAGTVIIMNPNDGGILAMASYPSYDPASYWKYGNEVFKNPAISSIFEPGSVFKILVMASALDSKVINTETICDICSGPFKVDKYLIETWNRKYNPDSSMQDIIVHSDNVGMVFVTQKMGADSLFDYLDKLGIGRLTGIDLQGEVSPELRKKGTWNIVDLATASFGQGIAVTPIQMIKAVSIIANGGFEISPQVVDKLQGNSWEEDIKPILGKRVFSEETIKNITSMMVEAARNGESKWTALRGFKVAGKTGTAQIPIAGHYDAEKTIASFVGFAPADKPKFVMLITLKEPKSSIWASETAAPLWYSVAKDLFPYLGIQPEN